MTKKYLKTPEEVIDALAAGKVVIDHDGYHYKMYKGVIFWKDKEQWDVAPLLSYKYGVYVEEPEQLKLEVGKFYKTRDGRKAWVVSQQKDEQYIYIVAILGEVDTYSAMKDGSFFAHRTSVFDIVAPWEE